MEISCKKIGHISLYLGFQLRFLSFTLILPSLCRSLLRYKLRHAENI